MLRPPFAIRRVLKRSLATLSLFMSASSAIPSSLESPISSATAGCGADHHVTVLAAESMSDGALRTPVLSQQEDAPVAKDAVAATSEEEEDQEEEVDKAAELLLPLTQEDKKRSKADMWGSSYQPHKKLKAELNKANSELLIERLEHQSERAALKKRIFELEAAEASASQLREYYEEQVKQLERDLRDARSSLDTRESIIQQLDKLIDQLREERAREGDVVTALCTRVDIKCESCQKVTEPGDDLACWSCFNEICNELSESRIEGARIKEALKALSK